MRDGLIAHFKTSFRERLVEWELSLVLMLWGVCLYRADMVAIGHFYGTLFVQVPPDTLAAATVVIGLARFIALLVNGIWIRTPPIRAGMAMLSLLFWAQISMGLLWSGVITPGWAVYPVFTILEFVNVYYAMVDARAAHEQLAQQAQAAQLVGADHGGS